MFSLSFFLFRMSESFIHSIHTSITFSKLFAFQPFCEEFYTGQRTIRIENREYDYNHTSFIECSGIFLFSCSVCLLHTFLSYNIKSLFVIWLGGHIDIYNVWALILEINIHHFSIQGSPISKTPLHIMFNTSSMFLQSVLSFICANKFGNITTFILGII